MKVLLPMSASLVVQKSVLKLLDKVISVQLSWDLTELGNMTTNYFLACRETAERLVVDVVCLK